jgi:hypothetical protein
MNESQRFAFMHPREPNLHSRYNHFSRHYTVTSSQRASARAGRNRCRQKLPVAIARSTEPDSSLSAGKEAHAGRNIANAARTSRLPETTVFVIFVFLESGFDTAWIYFEVRGIRRPTLMRAIAR